MRHPTRRMFLTDLGRTTAGLLVVGGGLVACSEDDPVIQAPTSAATPSAPTATRTAAGQPTEQTTAETTEEADVGEATGGAITPQIVELGFVAAYVLVRGGQAALVDTGVEGSEADILAVLEAAGLGWDAVGDIILTHNHPDHVGSLPAISTAAPDAALHGGAADIPTMQADREIAAVGDGATVFDLQIITTPGHTPGHLSVYDPAARFLVTGDALVGDGAGGLAAPPAEFTQDMGQAAQSVAKLAGFDVAEVLVAHGYPATGTAADLQALADSMGA